MCAFNKNEITMMQVSFTTHGYCAEMIKKGNLFEDGFTSECHKHGLIVNKQILLGPLVFLQHPSVYFFKNLLDLQDQIHAALYYTDSRASNMLGRLTVIPGNSSS